MKDYFKEAELVLGLLYFYHHGHRYQGRGVLTWDPNKGFHLEAILDDQAKSIDRIDLGRAQIPLKSDLCSIRFRPQGYDWAIAPNIRLSEVDKMNLLNRRLSVNFSKIIFCESKKPPRDQSLWHGTALYAIKKKLDLSDTVNVETKINGQGILRQYSSTGILYENDQRINIIGCLIDDQKLQIYWKLPKQSWSKSEAWHWAISIQDALSIWFGQTIQLLKREFTRDAQRITEIKLKCELSELGLLSPFNEVQFDKHAFVKLAEFFVRNPFKAEICRNIFLQLVNATEQNTRQAQEFLLSTILEASLRSIDQRPFTAKKDKSWNVGKGLENFFNTYLQSQEWESIRSRVMREHGYLRDRNAHPDWLFSQGGSLSEAEQAQSLDSMILMSRFYGYMILALADFRNLRPNFPASHQNWGAAATITTISSPDSENSLSNLHMRRSTSVLDEWSKQLSEARTYHERTMFWRNFHRGTD